MTCTVTVTPGPRGPREACAGLATIIGTLGNNKLAHRDGFRPSPLCPYGKKDGITHMLLECRITGPQQTARHNAAGRTVAQAAARGSLAAGIIMADVGQGKLPEGNPIKEIPARVPPTQLPGQGAQAEEGTDTEHTHIIRPDMLIRQTITESGTTLQYYHIVELKYTLDYNLEAVYGRAESHQVPLA